MNNQKPGTGREENSTLSSMPQLRYSCRMHTLTLARLLPGLALLAVLPSEAAAFEPARIVLAQGAGGAEGPVLEVGGIWPDTCPPRLDNIHIQGRDITLLASRETEGCRRSPTPYTLRSAPLAPPDPVSGSGIHRVRLSVAGIGAQESPSLAGFALLHLGQPTPMPALESGLWWAEQGEGEFNGNAGLGLSVETQGDLISLSIMGYDPHGGSTWYFGADTLTHGIAQLDLTRFDGGAGPFETQAAPESIHLSGQVAIETRSPAHAVLWFSKADPETGALDLRPISFVRFSFEQDPTRALLGRWLLAGDRAQTRSTHWLEWSQVHITAEGFQLAHADGSQTLHCLQPDKHGIAPPQLCRLDLGQGDIVELTDIALRRISGWDKQGHKVLLFRLD